MSRWSTAPCNALPAPPWPQRAPRHGPAPALLASLLVHALLLSLTFGGDGLGLPGLSLPWQTRRAEVPDLRVVLLAPPPAPQPPWPEPALETPPEPAVPTGTTAPAPRPAPADDTPPATPVAPLATAVLAVEQPALTRWSVPPLPPASAPVIAAFGAASSPVVEITRLRAATDTVLSREARTAELAQLDRARRDAQLQAQQQAERLAAAQAEAERQDVARAEAARQEAASLEAAKAEALRKAAARAEAARVEAAKAEAARLEAEHQDAQRQAAARLEAERQDAARRAAAQAEAARQETARAEAAKLAAAKAAAAAAEEQREARLRAIGQQLNEEAARRDAARQAQGKDLPSSWSSARRGRLFGRVDANAEMVLYAEAWARKIQLGQAFDGLRELVKQPHTDPLVTVAIRADGTVESISFYRSSGVPALDDAIRRVIEGQANYPAFPPALAREYDVIEIRRTWLFDTAIRLY